jgi:hypothetical protein
MLMESNKNLDSFLDDLLSGIVLPSDDEVRQETANLRNSQANKGRSKTAEHIDKRRRSMPNQSGENNPFYGKSHKTETKAAISAKKKGSVAPNKGATHTDEALQKMRKPRSEEGKTNMRKPRSKMLTCPHCNKTGAAGNMSRYHMDNCKSRP